MRLSIIITIIVSISITSCSDDGNSTSNNTIQQGELNQPCYPNQTCNEDLACADNVCTEPVVDNCGDGLIQPGETCDGSNMGPNTCEGIGFDAGTLSCNSDCTINQNECHTYECGNDLLDPGEECDGETSLSCLDYGFASDGVVTCGNDCVADTSQCPAICGDGIISGDEACDYTDVVIVPEGAITCQQYCDQEHPGTTPYAEYPVNCIDDCTNLNYESCNCH